MSAHRSYKVRLFKPTMGARRQFIRSFKRLDKAEAFARLQAAKAGEESWRVQIIDNGIIVDYHEVQVNSSSTTI